MKLFGLVNRATGVRRRAMLSVVAACATGLVLGLAPAQVHAAESTATGTYQNKQTGFCLDGNANGDVYTSVCNKNNPYQQWVFNYSTMTIRQVATDKCLYIPWDDAYIFTAKVSCTNPIFPWAQWIKVGDTRRNADTGQCLDSNWQKQVYPHTCNGGGYQNWQLNVISRT